MSEISKAACVGAGVIGAAWAARLAWNGIDVAVFDPHPEAERRLREVLANAERALSKLTMAPNGRRGDVRFTTDLADAVRDADFIQESAPERPDLKQRILAEVDLHAKPTALICSSTSGLLPSELQTAMARPERFMVGHPFNPVYLMPLVEVCGGEKTSAENIQRAIAFYTSIGMRPLHVRKEVDAFIADRLMEALWREALWLVNDGIATAEEIDDAMRFGPGLRWSFMGTFMVYRIAGGEDGMRHFLAQFGPSLKWPWTKLMDVPELTDELIDKVAAQSDDQAGDWSIRDLERKRDDCLVAVMQALKSQQWGAGATLGDYEKLLYSRAHADASGATHDYSTPLRLYETNVPQDWTDYNNHMNESRYLQIFCNTSDALLRLIGADDDYVSSGFSYYTAETHIMHHREVAALEPVHCTVQVLHHDEKRLHVFYRLFHSRTQDLLATGEQIYLHVDAKAGKACPAPQAIIARLDEIWQGHKSLPRPESAGRHVGQKKTA